MGDIALAQALASREDRPTLLNWDYTIRVLLAARVYVVPPSMVPHACFIVQLPPLTPIGLDYIVCSVGVVIVVYAILIIV